MPAASELPRSSWWQTPDGLRLHFRDYAGSDVRLPVLCLHGLTRNSEDFDELARHLAPRRRVLALDVRGRGQSAFDPDPMNYHPGVYARDTAGLLADLEVARCILIGTSMGGLIGMRLAHEHPALLAGVVLNDVGPEIGPVGLARVMQYTGKLPPVSSWAEAEANTRLVLGPALPGAAADDPVWRRLARRGYRETGEGRFEQKADPAIGQALAAGAGTDGPDPWHQFHALEPIPLLVLRGASSDILTSDILDRMVRARPDLTTAIVADRGHAPLLDEPDALAAIDDFLEHLP